MRTFRVFAQVTSHAYLDVQANSIHEANEIAETTDGGDFITMEGGEWEIKTNLTAHKSKVRPLCSTCGSDEVVCDAYASWDSDKQDWSSVDNSFDDYRCDSCDGECSVDLIPEDMYLTIFELPETSLQIAGYKKRGEHWNGFAVPYFTSSQVHDLVRNDDANMFSFEKGIVTIQFDKKNSDTIKASEFDLYELGAGLCWMEFLLEGEEADNG